MIFPPILIQMYSIYCYCMCDLKIVLCRQQWKYVQVHSANCHIYGFL